jgi:hypothetical protein
MAALLLACGRSEPAPLVPVANACTDRSVGSPERPWRVVLAPGFTFCVPPHWQPADGRPLTAATAWVIGRDTLRWDFAAPLTRGEVAFLLEGPDGRLLLCAPQPQPWTEIIGGAPAELMRVWCGHNLRFTAAVWRSRVLYFYGKAYGSRTAAEQLTVLRTVRFAAGPPSN